MKSIKIGVDDIMTLGILKSQYDVLRKWMKFYDEKFDVKNVNAEGQIFMFHIIQIIRRIESEIFAYGMSQEDEVVEMVLDFAETVSLHRFCKVAQIDGDTELKNFEKEGKEDGVGQRILREELKIIQNVQGLLFPYV
jgi:hypothetical protein